MNFFTEYTYHWIGDTAQYVSKGPSTKDGEEVVYQATVSKDMTPSKHRGNRNAS